MTFAASIRLATSQRTRSRIPNIERFASKRVPVPTPISPFALAAATIQESLSPSDLKRWEFRERSAQAELPDSLVAPRDFVFHRGGRGQTWQQTEPYGVFHLPVANESRQFGRIEFGGVRQNGDAQEASAETELITAKLRGGSHTGR